MEKNKYKNWLLFLLAFFAVNAGCYGEDGITAADFLKLPQGNRATAMGTSFVAFAEGPTSLYWNPAGLATGMFNEGRLVYNDWIEGIYYAYAAYRHRMESGGFGVSVTYLDSGEIVKRDQGREDSGSTYKLQDVAVCVGQGLRVSKYVNAGMCLEFITESADGESINGLAGGLGMQYKKKVNEHYIHTGMSVMNLGTRMGYEDKFPIPAVIRLGIGDELMNERLRGSFETDYYMDGKKMSGGAGMEFRVSPALDLRCGYRFGHRDISIPYGLTAGFGIKYTETVEYNFDYSISSMGDLGIVNRIGFGVKF
ncbi:MAG: PorV/PorQ family protein [Elusimicrobia bacterium]|nr:PorV/PorQ family protein [Elusimicrobiota bacterium]